MKSDTKINKSSSQLLDDLSFCVFDLETTGGNPLYDKIIEIGLVKVEKQKITGRKSFLINPEIPIPSFIQKLTSIQTKDVTGAPIIESVIDEIVSFMGDSILVAHNISFDIPFFNSVLKRLGRPKLENRTICTNLMTKYLIPNLMNSNLNYMSKIFNIPHEKAHRALDDATATANLLLHYLKIFIDKKITKLNHLYYPRNRFELDRINLQGNNSNVNKQLDNLKHPFIIVLKGDKGTIEFSLPCNNSQSEKNAILTKIDTLNWKTATIKIFGNFVDAIIHFNGLFGKMEHETRVNLISFLEKEHLANFKNDKVPGDFIIINHLAPEQFVIFPVLSPSKNSQLIFRYPGHQKKLFQYIKSKAIRITRKKLKTGPVHPELKTFINSYLSMKIEKQSCSSLFVFNWELPIEQSNKFFRQFDDFVKNNPNVSGYPRNHI